MHAVAQTQHTGAKHGITTFLFVSVYPFLVTMGMAFVIHVNRREHREHEDRTDALNLLQLQSTVQKRSSWERLTTDAVAQAQWPQDRSTSPKPVGDPLPLQELIPAPTYINIDFTKVIHLRTKLLLLDLGPVQPRASVVKWHLSTQEALSMHS